MFTVEQMRRRGSLGLLSACLFLLVAAVPNAIGSKASVHAQGRPTVWFAPLPDDPGMRPRGSRDYMKLFRRGAPWRHAAAHVRVFKLYESWITNFATPSQLQRIVADLRRRKIALAVEALPLTATAECGNGVEGFAGPGELVRLVHAIKQVGGRINYVAFDEPFAFGHLYDGPNACRWSSDDVARKLAAYVRKLRRWFPSVVAGDIEPLWAGVGPEVLEGWLDTYARVTGKPLPSFDLDMDFSRLEWPNDTARLESFAHSRGVRFGFIYIGEGASDREWSQTAEDRIFAYERKIGVRPDRRIFQSWLDRPDRVLPETRAGSFTWLIDRYFRPRPRLRLDLSANSAVARLTDRRGSPIAGKKIVLTGTPLDGSGVYGEYAASGTVPLGASRALVGLRMNFECGCSGPADLTLYEAAYREAEGANRVPNPRFDQGLDGWGAWGDGSFALEASERGGVALHVTAAPGQEAGLNSSDFAVTAGGRFDLQFGARVAPRSEGSGYFDLIFLGANGVELTRMRLRVGAASVKLGAPATDRNGRVAEPLAALRGGNFLVEAWFRGDNLWFPAYASTVVARPSRLLDAVRVFR